MELTQIEKQKEKRILKSKDTLRDLRGNIKNNIQIIEISEGEERDKGTKNYLKKQ